MLLSKSDFDPIEMDPHAVKVMLFGNKFPRGNSIASLVLDTRLRILA